MKFSSWILDETAKCEFVDTLSNTEPKGVVEYVKTRKGGSVWNEYGGAALSVSNSRPVRFGAAFLPLLADGLIWNLNCYTRQLMKLKTLHTRDARRFAGYASCQRWQPSTASSARLSGFIHPYDIFRFVVRQSSIELTRLDPYSQSEPLHQKNRLL